jgi:hypothetical protein
MKFDSEWVVICGKWFARHGNTIRGPFRAIARLAKGGWSDRSKIVAHVTSDGDVWHEVEFRTIREAKAAFATLREKRGAMSAAEYARRCRGVYGVEVAS